MICMLVMTLVTMMQVTAMTLVTKRFFASHRQLIKVALFIFIYDKDLSSVCTLHAEKKLSISFSFTLCCSEDM